MRPRSRAITVAPLLAAWTIAIGATPVQALDWPAPAGSLSDFAGVVDASTADSIEALAAELREKTGTELAVVAVDNLGGESIDPVAVDLFARWGIGKKGRDDGILILLAVSDRRVRIEVGYGLEGILPDGRCGAIIRQVMGPDLSTDRFGTGLLRGSEAIAGVIAADRGVTLARGGVGAARGLSTERGGGRSAGFLFLVWIAVIVIAMVLASRRRARSGQGWGNWRTRRRGWHDPWGGFGGGFGGFGGFGGRGAGGGFGGFGGGMSGGGGASGRF